MAELQLQLRQEQERDQQQQPSQGSQLNTSSSSGGGGGGNGSDNCGGSMDPRVPTSGFKTDHMDPRVAVAHCTALGRHVVAAACLPPAVDVLAERPAAWVLCKRWRRAGGGGGGSGAVSPGLLLCWCCTEQLPRVGTGGAAGAAAAGGGGGGQEHVTVSYPCACCPMVSYCSPQCRWALHATLG